MESAKFIQQVASVTMRFAFQPALVDEVCEQLVEVRERIRSGNAVGVEMAKEVGDGFAVALACASGDAELAEVDPRPPSRHRGGDRTPATHGR